MESEIKETEIITEERTDLEVKSIGTDYNYKHEVVWINAFAFLVLHLLGFWGFLIMCTGGVSLKTVLWAFFMIYLNGQGVTVGAHRLFTHKTYKATPLLKATLLILQVAAGQNAMFTWCRDHRLHHRYSDTDADPHNAKRGFFFSHMGWLMTKKHPYVIEFGRKIDMSDLKADWMVMAQRKYYFYIYFVVGFLIPVAVPIYYFNEPVLETILVAYFARHVLLLNGTWLVNSAAHLRGTRPYDKNILPAESWFVSFFTFGEGWHNYHHAYPWDYKCAESSNFLNISARAIELLAKFGLAYDLKMASADMIKNRIKKTGDGTHYELGNEEAKSSVTAFGPVHPLNPTYTTTFPVPDRVRVKVDGLLDKEL